jgi:hypothetical protein
MTTISMRHGKEGPRHDPYAFVEIMVTRKSSPHFTGSVTFHFGLNTWIKLEPSSGVRHVWFESEFDIEALFARTVGTSVNKALRACSELEERLVRYHACGSKYVDMINGYPGERLIVCMKCGKTLRSDFNRTAVE